MNRVFIVEDDDAIREAMQISLELVGYNVKPIQNSDRTIEEAIENPPDIILLDYLLSGKDGCELIHDLKKNQKTKSIPVIMLSAYPRADLHAKDCGADGFIAKPFDIDNLLHQVDRHILKDEPSP